MKNLNINNFMAKLSIISIITHQVLLIALIFIRPDLDPSWHTISEWAIGPYGWLMTIAFFSSAISYLAIFLTIKNQIYEKIGRIGLYILFICFIGTVGVGTFTTDPLNSPQTSITTTGILHTAFGSTALFLFPFAALLINLGLAFNNPAWKTTKNILLLTAGLPLAGFIGFITYTAIYVVPLGPTAYGPGVHIGWPPRVAFFTYMIWIIIVATNAIKIQKKATILDIDYCQIDT